MALCRHEAQHNFFHRPGILLPEPAMSACEIKNIHKPSIHQVHTQQGDEWMPDNYKSSIYGFSPT